MTIGDGYRAKNDEMGTPGLPFIRARELNKGFDTHGAEVLHERSVLAARDKLSRIGDVAFTSKGTIGRFARVAAQTPKFVYSPQVCFWRSTHTARLRPAILYLWMVSDDLINQITAVAGQTDMAPYVSLGDQRAMTMPAFGEGQHAVADRVEPLLELQDANLAESRLLAATRDLLLPKLMSGEIRVKQAEKAVQAVA
jgi:type I restriction enzyme, S subunit